MGGIRLAVLRNASLWASAPTTLEQISETDMTTAPISKQFPHRSSWTAASVCVLLAIAAFYLWTEHRAHLLGALPYLLLLACPITHMLMHRGHRSHGHSDHDHHESAS
jgi:hypothetical protein